MNSLWLENQKNSYDNPTNDKDFETEVCIVGRSEEHTSELQSR